MQWMPYLDWSFSAKSPINSDSVAKRDLQLKASYASLSPFIATHTHRFEVLMDNMAHTHRFKVQARVIDDVARTHTLVVLMD